ncbi:MAG: LuxR C-terminal-related transcriptional regulator [Treponema sp.]|jgi:DNA-binding NarL/FixJ family response regulator|nr:LuxR C-terminal-related transcriptional regulator [Treponema sp.]
MTGGTLVVSRAVNNHNYFKHQLESKGFKNVHITSVDKDGLNSIIYDMKPDLMIIGARFYQCSTPYMLGEIKTKFPNLNIAAVCLDEYPADLGMYFILNGVNSYFNMFEGVDQFILGFENILKGKDFVSEQVQKRIDMRKHLPFPAKILAPNKLEVIRCICNGFKKKEIADIMSISTSSVEIYRQEVYRSLNVRNVDELFRAALRLNIVTQEELVFCHKNFTLKPLPIKTNKRKNAK